MSTKYQGNDVVVLRDAHDGDVGYTPGSTDLVLVQMPDGSKKVLSRQDVNVVDTTQQTMVLATTYNGEEVTVLRNAVESDVGYNLKHVNQVLIQHADGTQRVVTRQDIVTSSPVPVGQTGQMGQPGFSGQPGQPGFPGQQGQVGQPGFSGQQGQVGQPGQPGHVGQPAQPGQSGLPGQPGQVGQPGRFPSQAPGQATPQPGTGTFLYKGQQVVILREAQAKDTGFVAGRQNQVLVKQPDGSEVAVDRKDVTQRA